MSQTSEQVLRTSIPYLGPAARHFLERQTRYHLNGLEFHNLEKSHLPELARWVNVSAALIIGDAKARKLADDIEKLSVQ